MGTHWHLRGPIEAYGVWGINFLHPHLNTTPLPFLQASDLYQTYHTSCCIHYKIRHQTLYTILPWPCQDFFPRPDFESSANDSM